MTVHKLYSWLNRMIDIVILSLLILLTSLLVVTVCSSLMAGVGTFHFRRKIESTGNLFETYFMYFKKSLGAGIVAQCALMLIYVIGYVNLQIANTIPEWQGVLVFALSTLFLLLCTMTISNFMVLQAKLDYKAVTLILKKSLLLSFIDFPRAFLIVISYIMLALFIFFLPPLLIFTVSTSCYIHERVGAKMVANVLNGAGSPVKHMSHMETR
ncbi:hypothetical protein G4V62_15015 [Bacillaceae bacterium SIJ1]|uniref:hypothetical protein n=1 Tax=Litoribacterium kuwaitense TaxID=1398745 RepID=UPI0013EB7E6A|nr:hypothetical protein [Litoribacterium kuwaitense]NGP46197.1 hypothetical protein [Litoribacterium kuwaitense]